MPDPLRLAATAAEIGMNYAAGRRQVRRDVSDILVELSLAIAAAIFVVAAVAFVFAAIWYYLVPAVGHGIAALIMAGLLLLLALAALGVGRQVSRSKRKPEPPAQEQLDLLLNEAGRIVQKNKGALLLAAFLAGLLTSERRPPVRTR